MTPRRGRPISEATIRIRRRLLCGTDLIRMTTT
jgi:hypothetical protein